MVPLLLALLLTVPASAEPLPAADTADLSGHTVVLSVDDGYHSVYENIYPLIKKYHMPITLAVITGCVGRGVPSYRPADRFLNVAEIREMMDSCNIEIASHTITHAWLTRLDSAAAWHEIADSKHILESLFGVKVVTFAYPYGDMDARVRRLTRRAGYEMARAVRSGEVNLWADPYRIPEVELRIETRLPAVLRHIRRHETTVLLLHRIVPRPRVFTEWPVKDFAALVEWLAQHRVQVVTLDELHREWWQRNLRRMLEEQLAAERGRLARLFEDVDVDATRTAHPR